MFKITGTINFSFKKIADATEISSKEGASMMDAFGAKTSKAVKERIKKGISPPLKPSTIEIRKERNVTGSKPLMATGSLYNSITHSKDGLQMLHYGIYHHEGFTPKKIPYKSLLSKRKGKTFFVNNNKNISVPARPFIFPSEETFIDFEREVYENIMSMIDIPTKKITF